ATSPRTWNLSATANAQPQINIGLASLNGSAASSFSLSFLNSMQQNTGTSGVVAINQNGYAPGSLVSYAINDDGTVVGSYSNEQSQLLGQIVLANFANNEGLQSQGDNVWSATNSSGVA
ncbi:flagellar hook-basal body complex protein, partial [Microvirga sp. 2MCAF38]